MDDHFRRIHPASPHPELVREAAGAVRGGGQVVFPTRDLYGLGADVFSEAGLKRIFQLKQRPLDKPVALLIRDRRDLAPLARDIPAAARQVMDAFWPGRVTVILEARSRVPALLTAGTGKIGVRMPEHPVAAALVAALNGPITGTSANLSNRPGCSRIQDLHPKIARGVDLVLDAGPLNGGNGSTVVDMTGDEPKVLREGTVSATEILAVLGHPVDPGTDTISSE
jgi:L-threonylcarbamoyladenylate synthase